MRSVRRCRSEAKLADEADTWRWSSLRLRANGAESFLAAGPLAIPGNWNELVHEPQTEAEQIGRGSCRERGKSVVVARWTEREERELGLGRYIDPAGRTG